MGLQLRAQRFHLRPRELRLQTACRDFARLVAPVIFDAVPEGKKDPGEQDIGKQVRARDCSRGLPVLQQTEPALQTDESPQVYNADECPANEERRNCPPQGSAANEALSGATIVEG